MEEKFKKLIAQYCEVEPEDMTTEMRFMEDLGFSSFDFMAFLGELEDTFDVEVDEETVLKIKTLGEAITYLKTLTVN